MSTWPENCPSCGAAWKIRSKTMGAANGQPHHGRCSNGHWWNETFKQDTIEYVAAFRDAVDSGNLDEFLGQMISTIGRRCTQISIDRRNT